MLAEFIYQPEGLDAWEEKQELRKAKLREYVKKNKEVIRKRAIQWSKENAERYKELKERRVWCDVCNKSVRKYGLNQHKLTKKHLKLMES